MWPPNTAARVDGRGFVSVGPPFPGVELEIIAGELPLPPRHIGEIVFRSPANTGGYFDNPEATRQLSWRDGYLRSGDLGYIDQDGYLFITGRLKNIIKRSGQTIWPQEVEEIVDRHAAVRYSATIGVDRGRIEGEQVCVFAEIRGGESRSDSELHDIALGIVDSLYSQLGFRPGRVYLLKPRAIPLTYNGKIQHARLKTRYLDGAMRHSGAILYPEY
jgi:fatty-acyl-CoA synthase